MPSFKGFVLFVGALTLTILIVRGGVATFHVCVPPAGCVYSQNTEFEATSMDDAPQAFRVRTP